MKFLLLLATSAFLITGCEKPNPKPEKKDPIYQDLKSKAESHKSKAKSKQEEIQDLRETIQQAQPNSKELATARRDLKKAKKALTQHRQKAKFYQIRAKRRKYLGRIEYRKAYKKGKPWPDPEEVHYYKVHNQLSASSSNGRDKPQVKDSSAGSSSQASSSH